MSYDLVNSTLIEYRAKLTALQILSVCPSELKSYRQRSVEDCLARVGGKPAVMLSGGIDSQFMVYCFKEAGVEFSPVVLDYEGLNPEDLEAAQAYCQRLGLKPTIVKHPIMWFMNRHCLNLGLEHGLRSPQFASHAYACANLKKFGYSGAIFGGNSYYQSTYTARTMETNGWVFGQTAAMLLDLPTFGEKIDWPIISSFCSWSWPLALALAAVSEEAVDSVETRYHQKAQAYRRAGAVILEQAEKYTGFEHVKAELEKAETPGYFETRFRFPLYAKTPNQQLYRLALTDEQRDALDTLAEVFHADNH